jgi:hypothetical protein
MNPLIKTFLIWKNRLFFKQKSFSFAATLNQAQSMLILLPQQVDGFSSVSSHLLSLEAIFSDLKTYFLLHFNTQGFISTLKNHEIILLKRENLAWSGVPKKDFVRTLNNFSFDLTLDMDLNKNFFNPYLGLLLDAKVRIGIKGRWSTPFYNLELNIPSHLSSLDEQYDSAIRILKNLRTGKTVEV